MTCKSVAGYSEVAPTLPLVGVSVLRPHKNFYFILVIWRCFCGRRLRNVQSFKTHILNYCPAHLFLFISPCPRCRRRRGLLIRDLKQTTTATATRTWKNNRFNWQNNSAARAFENFMHFSASHAKKQREITTNCVVCKPKPRRQIILISIWNSTLL